MTIPRPNLPHTQLDDLAAYCFSPAHRIAQVYVYVSCETD